MTVPGNKRARKRKRQDEEAESARHRFQYGALVAEVLRQPLFADLGFEPVDVEVLPHFDGSPEDIFAWLVFQSREQASRAREPSAAAVLVERARSQIVLAGFPADAAASFKMDFTSTPEIEAGGGRFYFFR